MLVRRSAFRPRLFFITARPPTPNAQVLGCLRCVPPYNARAVSCENEIVLSRFTELLAGV